MLGNPRQKLARSRSSVGAEPWGNGGFLRFSSFGTLPADIPAWRTDGPAAGSGRNKMTFNFGSIQQVAASLFAALLTSGVLVSAAIGPVAQLA